MPIKHTSIQIGLCELHCASPDDGNGNGTAAVLTLHAGWEAGNSISGKFLVIFFGGGGGDGGGLGYAPDHAVLGRGCAEGGLCNGGWGPRWG